VALSAGEEFDRAREIGVAIEKVVRFGFARTACRTVRAEQNGLHPRLARSQDVAITVVPNEDGVFRADLQSGEASLKQANVGFAIAVVA